MKPSRRCSATSSAQNRIVEVAARQRFRIRAVVSAPALVVAHEPDPAVVRDGAGVRLLDVVEEDGEPKRRPCVELVADRLVEAPGRAAPRAGAGSARGARRCRPRRRAPGACARRRRGGETGSARSRASAPPRAGRRRARRSPSSSRTAASGWSGARGAGSRRRSARRRPGRRGARRGGQPLGRRVDREPELVGDPGQAQEPQRIVGEDPVGHRAQPPLGQVGAGRRTGRPGRIAAGDRHRHGVHREVALPQVGHDIAAAPCRDVDGAAVEHHAPGAVAPPRGQTGRRRSGARSRRAAGAGSPGTTTSTSVTGPAQPHVAHAPADEVGPVAVAIRARSSSSTSEDMLHPPRPRRAAT